MLQQTLFHMLRRTEKLKIDPEAEDLSKYKSDVA